MAPDPEELLQDEEGEVQKYLEEQREKRAARWMYQDFRDYYYFREQMQLNVEMVLREKYLLGLFEGINREMKKRRGDGLSLNAFEVGFAADSSYLADIDTAGMTFESYADFYLKTHEQVREEHQRKLIWAEALKGRLLQDGTMAEVKRMFDFDLKLANDAYEDEEFALAVLRFEHMLSLYPYKNVDDLLFYLAESQYGAGYYLSALESYRILEEKYPESEYFVFALSRIAYVLLQLDRFDELYELWMTYKGETFGFEVIRDYDTRWLEVSDSLEIDDLPKETKKSLKDTLKHLKKNVPYDERMVDHASRWYYNIGLGLYLGEYYEEAFIPLVEVPYYTEAERKAAYLAGDAMMRLGKFKKAVEPLEFVSQTSYNKKDPEAVLGDLAHIKLGYTYFMLDRYDDSRTAFESVEEESDVHPHALLGQAWVAYERSDFLAGDSISAMVGEKYPDSPMVFQATALEGFSRELLGREDSAEDTYERMIEVLNHLSDVRRHMAERKIIAERIREMKSMEEDVVKSNDPELFMEYLKLSDHLNRLYKRARLAEIVELNSRVEAFLIERDSVATLLEEYDAYGDTMQMDEYKSLQGMYNRLESQLSNLYRMIQLSGYAAATRNPTASQRLAQMQYHNEASDSLIRQTNTDLERVELALQQVREARELARNEGNLPVWIDIDIAAADLGSARRTYEEKLLSLSEGKMVEISEDVEDWREFALTRYAISDVDFDYLVQQITLLEDLSANISTIDQLVEEKKQMEEERAKQAPPVELEAEDAEPGEIGPQESDVMDREIPDFDEDTELESDTLNVPEEAGPQSAPMDTTSTGTGEEDIDSESPEEPAAPLEEATEDTTGTGNAGQ
ncbi:hypothetical protein GF324_08600 [bacterium]|nr:hypothetical protein [bacterium]